MRLIGFNFTKISIEDIRSPSQSLEEVKINTEMDIISIEEVKKSPLNTKDAILSIDFTYNVNYNPSFAKIAINGKILVALDPKLSKDVLQEWKDKKMPSDFRLFLLNIVLRKSTLKALQLEDELNLPLHVPMPSFRKEENSKE